MSVWGPYRGTVEQVRDGDTVYCRLDVGFDLNVYVRVRLVGQASNELAAPDGSGKAARAYAMTLLPVNCPVAVTSQGWDKYGGRIDGSIRFGALYADDFTAEMIRSGYAVAWNGVGKAPVVPYPVVT